MLAILGIALVIAVGAACLPDNPYQRWQLVENTLFANATWSYERIHFDPRPIDVAVIGPSRGLLGISAPRVEATLRGRGVAASVANLSVIEDGRNLEWAIVDELFRSKRPRLLVVLVSDRYNRWGHRGFKYVAPAAAIAWPLRPFLHNSLYDLAYLPYRQLLLFGARSWPAAFSLRDAFDPAFYARKPSDFTVSQTWNDGNYIDMDHAPPPAALRAEAIKFKLSQRPSRLPATLAAVTETDNRVYVEAMARLAHAHGARVLFVFIPEFEGKRSIEDRDFYARLGSIEDYGDLAADAALYQSFAHLNHRGAMIASDRVATAVAAAL